MIRLLLLAVSICQAASFVAPLGRRRSATVISLRYSDRRERDEDEPQNYYDDFADYSSPSSSQPPSLSSRRSASPPTVPEDVFARSLERRRADVQRKDEALLVNWGTGVAKTYGAFTINERFYEQQNSPEQQREQTQLPFDWVRRLDLGAYPRVACGSAHGGLFVADLEAKKLVAEAPNAHSSASNGGVDSLDEKLKNLIYGAYDGGGPLSIAMHGTSIVASSGGLLGPSMGFSLVVRSLRLSSFQIRKTVNTKQAERVALSFTRSCYLTPVKPSCCTWAMCRPSSVHCRACVRHS
mmetsp:Transcript_28624/g.64599  ORF Transcript_28624/g.64599 Transcript_28624/m.64599 type:complete len:296 (-) Transcript_28624:1013-1900(-)